MLFTAAKVAHLGLLPQGQPERLTRVEAMVRQMDDEGFGACTFHRECEAACPKAIPVNFIARMHGEWLRAKVRRGRRPAQAGDSAGG
jgi:succinate dehydrogenase / fumarate reductase iron-sulfur subunit